MKEVRRFFSNLNQTGVEVFPGETDRLGNVRHHTKRHDRSKDRQLSYVQNCPIQANRGDRQKPERMTEMGLLHITDGLPTAR